MNKEEQIINIVERIKKAENPSLTGNLFYKQNFHFQLKDNSNISLDTIKNKINLKSKENRLSVKLDDLPFESYTWGLSNASKNILIIKDNGKKLKNSISVYILNENKQDKYEILNFLLLFFKKLNCFQEASNNNVDFHFYYGNDFINFEELKEDTKTGNKKHKNYFVSDLINYIGGDKLRHEIEIERKKEDIVKAEQFFKANSYVTSAKVTDFKLFSELEIKNLSKLNVIIGKNGTGKTSLLQAIAIGLVPYNTNEINDRNFREYKNYICGKEKRDAEFAEIEIKWSGNFKRRLQVHYYELVEDKSLPQTYLALAYGENLFTDKVLNLLDHISELDSGNGKSHNVASLFNDYFEKMPNPLDVLNKLQDSELPPKYSNQKRQELIEIRELLHKTLNSFLAEQPVQTLKIELRGRTYKFIDSNNAELNLYQISEGYRSNIILITDICVKILSARNRLLLSNYKIGEYSQILKTVKGTILIDEFDKHLHPTWQKTFILSLRKLFPKIQFILTTHNIIALQSAEGENAYILDNPTNELLPKRINLGYSIEGIYDEFFDGKNDYYGTKTNALLNKLKKLKQEIITKNDFKIMDTEQFKNVVVELQSLGNEINVIVAGEIGQLKIRKKHAEARKNK